MALARLALKNLSNKVYSSTTTSTTAGLVRNGAAERSFDGVSGAQRQRWNDELLKRFMSTSSSDKVASETSDGKEVSVSEGGKKSKLFPTRRGKKGLWKRDGPDFVPSIQEFFPSGLGNALLQATENINKLFQKLDISPSNLMGRVKEQDDHYKLRYEVPGLSKEDLKITVDDGVLTIKGEHKEEEEDGSDDEYWSASSYGYYNTSMLLPDDAKADEIKAELKNGVLFITIPRTEKHKKDEKQIPIH